MTEFTVRGKRIHFRIVLKKKSRFCQEETRLPLASRYGRVWSTIDQTENLAVDEDNDLPQTARQFFDNPCSCVIRLYKGHPSLLDRRGE